MVFARFFSAPNRFPLRLHPRAAPAAAGSAVFRPGAPDNPSVPPSYPCRLAAVCPATIPNLRIFSRARPAGAPTE